MSLEEVISEMEDLIGSESSYSLEPQDFIESIGGWIEQLKSSSYDWKDDVRWRDNKIDSLAEECNKKIDLVNKYDSICYSFNEVVKKADRVVDLLNRDFKSGECLDEAIEDFLKSKEELDNGRTFCK